MPAVWCFRWHTRGAAQASRCHGRWGVLLLLLLVAACTQVTPAQGKFLKSKGVLVPTPRADAMDTAATGEAMATKPSPGQPSVVLESGGMGNNPAPVPASVPVVAIGSEPASAPEPVVAIGSEPASAPEPVVAIGSEPASAPEPVVAMGSEPAPDRQPSQLASASGGAASAPAPVQIPVRGNVTRVIRLARLRPTPATEALLSTNASFIPLALVGPELLTTVTPLVLTAPQRRDHACSLLRSLNISQVDQVLFPAPMATDSSSGVAEFYKAWDCEASFEAFPAFRTHMMWHVVDAAVFLGHVRMLGYFLDTSSTDYLLVVEDDAVPGANVTMATIHELISRVANDLDHRSQRWDVINLGQSNYDSCPGERLIGDIRFTGKVDRHALIRPSFTMYGSLGLLYSRGGAARVLEQVQRAGPNIFGHKAGVRHSLVRGCFTFDDWLSAGQRCQPLLLSPPLFFQDDLESIRLGRSYKNYKKPDRFCQL
eukprot:jgi/Mesvir1/6956/Mv09103-RA.1